MTQFRFPLQSMLVLRRAARDRRRADLHAALAAVHELEARLEQLQQQREPVDRQLADASRQLTLSPSRLRRLHAIRSQIMRVQMSLRARYQNLADRAAAEKIRVTDSVRDVQVLENLRDSRQHRYRCRQARQAERDHT